MSFGVLRIATRDELIFSLDRVIGGSVSSGHGMDTIGKPTWHQRWFERFKADFPGHHQLFDGSVPAMNSAFFSFCFTSLIPDDLDLYFIEVRCPSSPSSTVNLSSTARHQQRSPRLDVSR